MRRIANFSRVVLLCLLLSPVSLMASQEDGNNAFARKDYAKALEILEPYAHRGDVQAQVKVGFMYFYGEGIGRDYSKAAMWLTRAGNQGNPIAQTMLAKMYENGWGVGQDYVQAMFWCKMAAEKGYADAQAALGSYYSRGIGCIQSTSAAMDWFYKAGISYLERGNRDMALTMVDLMKEISPDHFMMYKLLNLIYDESGEGNKEP